MVLFLVLNYSLLLCRFRGTPLPSRLAHPVSIEDQEALSDSAKKILQKLQVETVSAVYRNPLLATFSFSFILVSVLLIFRVKNLLQEVGAFEPQAYGTRLPVRRAQSPERSTESHSLHRGRALDTSSSSAASQSSRSKFGAFKPSSHPRTADTTLPAGLLALKTGSPRTPGANTLGSQTSGRLGHHTSSLTYDIGVSSKTSNLLGDIVHVQTSPAAQKGSKGHHNEKPNQNENAAYNVDGVKGTREEGDEEAFRAKRRLLKEKLSGFHEQLSAKSERTRKEHGLVRRLQEKEDLDQVPASTARAWAEAKHVSAVLRQQGSESTGHVPSSVLRNILDQSPVTVVEISSAPQAGSLIDRERARERESERTRERDSETARQRARSASRLRSSRPPPGGER
jgi:hypothetical protein